MPVLIRFKKLRQALKIIPLIGLSDEETLRKAKGGGLMFNNDKKVVACQLDSDLLIGFNDFIELSKITASEGLRKLIALGLEKVFHNEESRIDYQSKGVKVLGLESCEPFLAEVDFGVGTFALSESAPSVEAFSVRCIYKSPPGGQAIAGPFPIHPIMGRVESQAQGLMRAMDAEGLG